MNTNFMNTNFSKINVTKEFPQVNGLAPHDSYGDYNLGLGIERYDDCYILHLGMDDWVYIYDLDGDFVRKATFEEVYM